MAEQRKKDSNDDGLDIPKEGCEYGVGLIEARDCTAYQLNTTTVGVQQMNRREYKVETIESVPVCDDCGGELYQSDNTIYMSNPPQTDFKCKKCGKDFMLRESDWPKIETRRIGGKGSDE